MEVDDCVHPWTPWGYDTGGSEVGRSQEAPRFKEFMEIGDGVELGDACRWQCTGNGTGNYLQSMDNLVFQSLQGDSDVLMPEFNCVGYELAFGVGLDKLEAPIGVQGRANVEAFLSTKVPRATGAGFGMDEDTTTHWSKKSFVEKKGP